MEVSNFFYDELTKNNYILYAAEGEKAVGMVIIKKETKLSMHTPETYDFKFYEWEDKLKDKPFLKQPFGQNSPLKEFLEILNCTSFLTIFVTSGNACKILFWHVSVRS